MIWALLALLGIPIWFIAAILVGVFYNRKQVKSSPEVFEFVERKDDGWTRGAAYGRWVSDVFIEHKGPGLVRSEAHQVTDIDVDADVADPPKKIGESAALLTLRFAETDSETRRIAVNPSARARAERVRLRG